MPVFPSLCLWPRCYSLSCCSWCCRLSAPHAGHFVRGLVSGTRGRMCFGGRRPDMASTHPAGRAGVEVRLEELRRSYVGVTALDGLSLTLAPGELVALLGPSGCGKTTAMRLVAGLEEANEGRIVFGGEDVTNLPANKREIGMVFQAYSLFPHMTATQNVEFGMQLHRVGTDERRQRAGAMLELVGLSVHAHKYAHQLSGGQQQ